MLGFGLPDWYKAVARVVCIVVLHSVWGEAVRLCKSVATGPGNWVPFSIGLVRVPLSFSSQSQVVLGSSSPWFMFMYSVS